MSKVYRFNEAGECYGYEEYHNDPPDPVEDYGPEMDMENCPICGKKIYLDCAEWVEPTDKAYDLSKEIFAEDLANIERLKAIYYDGYPVCGQCYQFLIKLGLI